jgi:hypothetical protein
MDFQSSGARCDESSRTTRARQKVHISKHLDQRFQERSLCLEWHAQMIATPAIDQHDDNNPCKHAGNRQMKESEGERKERRTSTYLILQTNNTLQPTTTAISKVTSDRPPAVETRCGLVQQAHARLRRRSKKPPRCLPLPVSRRRRWTRVDARHLSMYDKRLVGNSGCTPAKRLRPWGWASIFPISPPNLRPSSTRCTRDLQHAPRCHLTSRYGASASPAGSPGQSWARGARMEGPYFGCLGRSSCW